MIANKNLNFVFGLGFGDEGKGSTVSYLCSLNSSGNLVIRFSGGHQAGHTVANKKFGLRHVHSSFGSGTLLAKAPTYWSRFCTVDPYALVNEYNILRKKKATFRGMIYLDPDCPITTPYDSFANKRFEDSTPNGSCGVGFGTTMQREEDFVSLKVRDLFDHNILREKLALIKDYYSNKFNTDLTALLLVANQAFRNAVDCLKDLVIDKVFIIKDVSVLHDFTNLTFEGSQGLLLDQHYGFFPNVTRSNTGTTNILNIINDYNLIQSLTENGRPIDISFNSKVYLVTRAYQTRHGKGFMSKTIYPYKIRKSKDETNVTNTYQGEFKRMLLDLSLIEYAINSDIILRNFPRNSRVLVITCLDHVMGDWQLMHLNDNHPKKYNSNKGLL